MHHDFGSGVIRMVKRIGLFGGSFNPIHIGHLVIAEAAWQEFGLEKSSLFPPLTRPIRICIILINLTGTIW